MISIIVAKSLNNVIGKNNTLPWKLSDDLKKFKELTTNNIVVMGRKTYESIGKPLPNRINIVLTSKNNIENVITYNNIEYLKDFILKNKEKNIFIIGGASLFEYFIDICDKLYITEVLCDIEGDTFFPKINKSYWKFNYSENFEMSNKNQYPFIFKEYERYF